jgi:hypothetical protein
LEEKLKDNNNNNNNGKQLHYVSNPSQNANGFDRQYPNNAELTLVIPEYHILCRTNRLF